MPGQCLIFSAIRERERKGGGGLEIGAICAWPVLVFSAIRERERKGGGLEIGAICAWPVLIFSAIRERERKGRLAKGAICA